MLIIRQSIFKFIIFIVALILELYLCMVVKLLLKNIEVEIFGYKFNRKINNFCLKIFYYFLENTNNTNGIKMCYLLINILYKNVKNTTINILDLLRNRCYNCIKKRYDAIFLKYEQVIIALVFLSFCIFTILNILFYYILFNILYVLICNIDNYLYENGPENEIIENILVIG